MLYILLFWFASIVLVAAWAESKNRSYWNAFMFSIIFSPVLGALVVLCLNHGGKKCPSCAEQVKIDALKCRYCQHAFAESSAKKSEIAATAT